VDKKKVAVLFGGCSEEYEVSLQSAYSVIANLNRNVYDVVPLGITRQGAWLRYYGSPERIPTDTWMDDVCVPAIISPDRDLHGMLEFRDSEVTATRIDVAFPVLHGKNGEDGTLQGLLTMAGIPFVGCGTSSSAMCMDKDVAHRIVNAAGIEVPPSIVLRSKVSGADLLERICALKFPLFVKPANAGSSFGITRVLRKDEVPKAIAAAFQHDDKVILEEAVDGFEVGCAILGNDSLIIGELDEIELSSGFFDYEEKYTLKTSKIHVPARLDAETTARLKQTAVAIYHALNCSGFARVDMFITPDKKIIFSEVNTIPGFTAHSRYPSMLNKIGISFEQIVDTLINLALQS